ncbi:MAG: glycosyltransferase [Phycisphaerae bacterium]|nr:glycosyltransferase [Phycisphaerae bacterium]
MVLAFLDFVVQLSWASVWFWLLGLIGLVWARRHLQLNRADSEPILSPADAAGADDALPKLTVLVAAKDEEANIGRCLRGLLAQEYPNLEVIASNDRSEDRTGEIIDEVAGRDPRLKAVHVTHLPEGWAGKNHAMHQGMQRAGGDYLCFTDADCRFHAPELLAAAVRFARRENVDFLSVLPDLEADTFWERVVQPPAGAIMVFWFPPEKVNNPNSPRAYANGAFMLMSRPAYDTLGGHEQVKTALNEDMHFARRAKELGLRLRVLRGTGMYSVRMYAGLRQIWNGWSRIFYCCFGTLPRLLVSVIFLSVFSVLPTLSLLAAPFLGPLGPGIAIAAGLTCVIQQTVLWRFYALSRTPPAWALTWVLGAGLCLAITLNAMTRHFGVKTRWRGTTYQGGT